MDSAKLLASRDADLTFRDVAFASRNRTCHPSLSGDQHVPAFRSYFTRAPLWNLIDAQLLLVQPNASNNQTPQF
jgi:hypothetical protein